MEVEKAEIGRLCFRADGDFWLAYWTPNQDNMDGAQLLGSILLFTVERPDRKRQFMDLMRGVFIDHVKRVTGLDLDLSDIRPAPESERR